jgi:transposase
MDQRTQFIADYLRDSLAITEPCEHYGVSRKTGYKWIERYLPDRSNSAPRTPSRVRDATIPLFSDRRPTAQAPVWKGASSLG